MVVKVVGRAGLSYKQQILRKKMFGGKNLVLDIRTPNGKKMRAADLERIESNPGGLGNVIDMDFATLSGKIHLLGSQIDFLREEGNVLAKSLASAKQKHAKHKGIEGLKYLNFRALQLLQEAGVEKKSDINALFSFILNKYSAFRLSDIPGKVEPEEGLVQEAEESSLVLSKSYVRIGFSYSAVANSAVSYAFSLGKAGLLGSKEKVVLFDRSFEYIHDSATSFPHSGWGEWSGYSKVSPDYDGRELNSYPVI